MQTSYLLKDISFSKIRRLNFQCGQHSCSEVVYKENTTLEVIPDENFNYIPLNKL